MSDHSALAVTGIRVQELFTLYVGTFFKTFKKVSKIEIVYGPF